MLPTESLKQQKFIVSPSGGWKSQDQGLDRKNVDTKTDIHTGRMACADEGRDLGDASISQGEPKIVSTPPEARGET